MFIYKKKNRLGTISIIVIRKSKGVCLGLSCKKSKNRQELQGKRDKAAKKVYWSGIIS
jgi:hypothetical protein